jgi:hypothetical protein
MKRLPSHRLVSAAFIFLVTLAISLFSLSHNRQLGQMAGMAEEYFDLGIFLTLTYGFPLIENTPFVFRPPGYSFFIASVLTMWGGLSDDEARLRKSNDRELEIDIKDAVVVVLIAQCLLLSLSSVFLFLWLSSFLGLPVAMSFALAFGCNPYTIILTGLLHYGLLHIFFIIIASYALSHAVTRQHPVGLYLFFAGVLWGLSALVRPVALILPVFAFFIFLYRLWPSWMSIAKATIVFAIGMTVVIAPYTLRNYALTQRFIPVNAQAGAVFWGATAAQSDRDPNHFRWWNIWRSGGRQIFEKITDKSHYSYTDYIAHNLELEDEFSKQAIQNLSRQPNVFVYNFVQNVLTFNIDINSVFIKAFQFIQDPHKKIDKQWFEAGNPQGFHSSASANAFSGFIYLLTVLSAVGVGLALRKRDPALLVPGCVYVCLCIAHAITVMDLMHYYIKIPFLFVFAAYFVNAMSSTFIHVPASERRISLASVLNGVVIVLGAGLSIAVL